MSMPVKLILACPCLPVLEVLMSTTLHGLSFRRMFVPCACKNHTRKFEKSQKDCTGHIAHLRISKLNGK